jgi:hypothetical protein
MREHIRRIRPKDHLSSRHQNQIVDRVNELSNPKTTQTVALFQATSLLQFPGRNGVPGTIFMPPFCSGKRVSYSFYEQKIGTQYTDLTEPLYFPQAERDPFAGNYGGVTDEIEIGEWYWCVWNTETGRWEIVYAQGGLPPGDNTNDILRWEESSGSGEGGQWVIHSAPPIVGNFALMVQDGVMKWEAYRTFVCDEDSGSAEEEQQEW